MIARAATLVGLASGLAGVVLMLADGEIVAAIEALVLAAGLGLVVRQAAPADRAGLSLVAAVAYGSRLAVMVLLHELLVAGGRGGHLVGDDAAYQSFAEGIALTWRGEPSQVNWIGLGYLFGSFTYLEAGVFYLFGPHGEIVKVLNCGLGALVALATYDLARLWWERRAAVVAGLTTAFWPSLFLWSILGLKDVIAVSCALATVWAAARLSTSRAPWRLLAFAYASLAVVMDVRLFVLLLLGWLLPFAVALARRSVRERALYGGASFLASGVLLALSGYGFYGVGWLGPASLQYVEIRGTYGSLGARTGFNPPPQQQRPPVVAQRGQSFLIYDLALDDQERNPPSTVRPPAPTPNGTVIAVDPGTYLVLPDGGDSAAPSPTVGVRSGDLIVMTGASQRPVPTLFPMRRGEANAQQILAAAEPADLPSLAARGLARLPRGLAFAIGAPFPWSASSVGELAAAPQMLAWYALLASAAVALFRARRALGVMWFAQAYVAGTFLGLALVEGNVGTIFRHRAMIEPVVIALAAPSLMGVVDRLRRRSGARG